MKILAIDTATTSCSVAVRAKGLTVAYDFEPMVRGQSEALIPMVLSVVSKTELNLEDLDLIAVTRGPGAFTGLRIGLAAARGLALASAIPCCGITTTETIAEAARQTEKAPLSHLVALDSKRSDLYIQAFDPDGKSLGGAKAVAVETLSDYIGGLALSGPVCVVGDAAERALAYLPDSYLRSAAPDFPDARYVAALADQMVASGGPLPEPSPLYLRPPDAALPKNGGRLRP